MVISGQALEERNRKIRESIRTTRQRRSRQVTRTFTCKLDYRKLDADQLQALRELFLDAKRVYNECVTSPNVFDYEPDRMVTVRMPDGTHETRPIMRLSQQMIQGIVQQARANVRSLAALKRNGHKVGALKPVRSVDCIPLKQKDRTYRLNGSYIHVSRVPGMMHLTGIRQLEGWEIGPAKLIRKAGGYYVAFTCFQNRADYEREHPRSTPLMEEGGLDAGLAADITESDGTKTIRRYPDTPKARYWARRRSRRDRHAKGWWKANRMYRREMERLRAQRRQAALEELHRLTGKYARIVIQNEQIRSWKRRDRHPRGGRILQGSVVGRLYAMLKPLPQVTVLDQWQPTTSWCPQCGRRTPTPPGQRMWRCAYCGLSEDRDVHAARNMPILATRPLTHRELRQPRDVPVGPYAKAA